MGAFKESSLLPADRETISKRDKFKRKVLPRTKVFTNNSLFTLRKNVEFGVDDPQYELTVVLCDTMDKSYFTNDVCDKLRKAPLQLKDRLMDIVPNLQCIGVLEGGHFTSKVTPYHYHFMLSDLTDEQILKIQNYCSEKFVKFTLAPIRSVTRYKNYLCKKKDRFGHTCKLSRVSPFWKGKFLQKMITCNLNVKSNIKKRVISTIDTSLMRVSIGYKFLFNSFLNLLDHHTPLNINRFKREYILKPREKLGMDDLPMDLDPS